MKLRSPLLTALTAGLVLAGASAVSPAASEAYVAPTVGPTAPRADVSVTGATFTWGINGYAQKGVFGPWTITRPSDDATRLVGSVSGGSQNEYAVDPVPVTSMPASSPARTPNAVKFVFGTGTADPATGAADLSWSGSYTVNSYPAAYGAPDETYADPRLSMAADGSGSLSMTVALGAGKDIDGNPTPARDLGRLTVLEFGAGSAASTTSDSYRYTPDYQGVTVDISSGGTAQVRSCSTDGGATGTWGAWPAAFVTAMPDFVRPHFYSTGCAGLQDNKPPLPLDVDLGVSGQAPTTIQVGAATTRYGQAASATVTVTTSGTVSGTVSVRSSGVELGTASLSGGHATVALGKPATGSYPLTATYFGSSTASPSSAATRLTVSRARSSTAVSLSPRPTTTKAGKAVVRVASPTTTPTGRVTLVVRKGSKIVKRLTATLKAGRATLTVPKAARGSYQVTASYAGTGNVAASAKTASYRVR